MARSRSRAAVAIAAWLTLVGGTWLIATSSLQYLQAGPEHPFLLEHGDRAKDPLWLGNLAVHIVAGVVCLASSFLQFFRPVTRRYPAIHRILGRIYMISVLAVLCPTGFYLAPFATGGIPGKTGFFLLGILTTGSTAMAWRTIRQGDVPSHIAWSIRSMAMVTSAITFRLLFLFLRDAAPTPEDGFIIALYLSTFGNAAVAELAIARFRQRKTTPDSNRPAPADPGLTAQQS